MIGHSKYDKLAGLVRRKALANAAFVLVVGGAKGTAASLQALALDQRGLAEAALDIARMLREAASDLERDAARVLGMSDAELDAMQSEPAEQGN